MKNDLTTLLEESDDKADLTPMIDCVFLLLLFFIVTSTFSEETNLFNIVLPKAANAEVRSAEEALTIHINKNGDMAIGEELLTDDKLWEFLEAKHKASPIKTVVIKGDRKSPYEKVALAIDMAQALKIEEVTLAVEGR